MKKINCRILIADDQDEVLIAARLFLKRQVETVVTLNNPKDILSSIAQHQIELVLLDMNFRLGYEDGREGIYWFKEIREQFPDVHILLMTSYGQVERAVEGMKLGAIDYILKPWDNDKLLDSVKQTVKKIRKNKTSTKEQSPVMNQLYAGISEPIQKLYKMAQRIACTDANVLLLGENGTGKYVLASFIHQQSLRAQGPFVHVDLGALHENLFESDLFGYVRGAFTDAKQDTAGRFEAAAGGTIFLDEIGNIPLRLQTKLLQVIQSKTVVRLGENKARTVDVRIIVATNTDLKIAVEQRTFREDLYYRINTIELLLPALRDRVPDIPLLVNHFLNFYSEKYQQEDLRLADGVLEKVAHYAWPGNIRELQNRIERGVILAEDNRVTWEGLGFSELPVLEKPKNEPSLAAIEKFTIEQTLVKHKYNVSRCAEALGLSRQALYRKMEKYNIHQP